MSFAATLGASLRDARARKGVHGTEIPAVSRVMFLRPVVDPRGSGVDVLYVIEPCQPYDAARDSRHVVVFVWDLCSDLDGMRIASDRSAREPVYDPTTGKYKDLKLHTLISPELVSQFVIPIQADAPFENWHVGDADYLRHILSRPDEYNIVEYVGSVQQSTLSVLPLGAVVMIGDADHAHSMETGAVTAAAAAAAAKSGTPAPKTSRKKRTRGEEEEEFPQNPAPKQESKKHRGDKTIGMLHINTLIGGLPMPLASVLITKSWLDEGGGNGVGTQLLWIVNSVLARNMPDSDMTSHLQTQIDSLFSASDVYKSKTDTAVKAHCYRYWIQQTERLYKMTRKKYFRYLLRFSPEAVEWSGQLIQQFNEKCQHVIEANKSHSRTRTTVDTPMPAYPRISQPAHDNDDDDDDDDDDEITESATSHRNFRDMTQQNLPDVVGRGLGGIICRFPFHIERSLELPPWARELFEELSTAPPSPIPDKMCHRGMIVSG